MVVVVVVPSNVNSWDRGREYRRVGLRNLTSLLGFRNLTSLLSWLLLLLSSLLFGLRNRRGKLYSELRGDGLWGVVIEEDCNDDLVAAVPIEGNFGVVPIAIPVPIPTPANGDNDGDAEGRCCWVNRGERF